MAHEFRDTHGGRRAFVQSIWHAAQNRTGAFARYRRIDWSRVSRVVFVCKGNICRSPFAEYRFRGSGRPAVSAGLEADPGKPADSRAQLIALRTGVDLSRHKSQTINDLPLHDGDLVLAFEPRHAKALDPIVRLKANAQVTLLGLWAVPPVSVYMHDPYGLSEAYFERCFAQISLAIDGVLARLSGNSPTPRDRLNDD